MPKKEEDDEGQPSVAEECPLPPNVDREGRSGNEEQEQERAGTKEEEEGGHTITEEEEHPVVAAREEQITNDQPEPGLLPGHHASSIPRAQRFHAFRLNKTADDDSDVDYSDDDSDRSSVTDPLCLCRLRSKKKKIFVRHMHRSHRASVVRLSSRLV